MNMKYKNNGFTLIEMLVVISLIGILAAIALVSFGGAQKQARDSARKSDLKQYQTSLELYGNMTNGLYPSTNAAVKSVTDLCGYLNSKLEPDIACAGDTKNASDATYAYKYVSDTGTAGTATSTKYVMSAKLEAKTGYMVVCSNGKVGLSLTAPTTSTCPTLTQL